MTIRPLVRSLSYSASMPLSGRRRIGEVAPVTPPSGIDVLAIDGIYAWFDPTDSIVSSSGDVSQYTNKVSGNPNLVEATFKPTTGQETIFGRPAITADGVDDRMTGDLSVAPMTLGDLTIHFTVNIPTFTGVSGVPFSFHVASTDRYDIYFTEDREIAVFCKWGVTSQLLSSSTGVWDFGEDHVITWTYQDSGRRTRVYVDDVLILDDTVSNPMDEQFAELLLFEDVSPPNEFEGSIGEIIIIQDLATDEERAEQVGHMSRSNTATKIANVSRNNNLPAQSIRSTSSPSFVNQNSVSHYFLADCTEVQPVFHNGSYTNQTESNGTVDYFLRASIYYNGEFYPMTFSGEKDVYLAKEKTTVKADPIVGLTGVKGERYHIVTRRVAVTGSDIVWNDDGTIDSGTDTTYGSAFQWDNTIEGSGVSDSSTFRGTDLTVDYTDGTGLPRDLYLGETAVSGGALVNTNAVNGGVNYSLLATTWYHGWAGRGNEGALIPGTGASGFLTQSGGIVSRLTIGSGGSGYDSLNAPKAYISAGAWAENGKFSASAVLARVVSSTISVLALGDSYLESSVPSPDNISTPAEYVFSNHPMLRIAAVGMSAVGYSANKTAREAYMNDLKGWGFNPTHVANLLGINDAGESQASPPSGASIKSRVEGVTTSLLAIWPDASIITQTLPPRTTSTDSWATTANQTAYSSIYVENGDVEQYNADMIAGTGFTRDYVLDFSGLVKDPTEPWKWIVLDSTNWSSRLSGAETTGSTYDGVHLNLSCKQYFRDNMGQIV